MLRRYIDAFCCCCAVAVDDDVGDVGDVSDVVAFVVGVGVGLEIIAEGAWDEREKRGQ